MTQSNRDSLFRRAADLEDGQPVSAGVRVMHVQAKVGRIYPIDLSAVPESLRERVIADIQRIVADAQTTSNAGRESAPAN